LYLLSIAVLLPGHLLLVLLLRWRVRPRSVVHVGELRHVVHDTVAALKAAGLDATYVGLGHNPFWTACDVALPHLSNPVRAALRDSVVFWRVVAPHAVVHCHCLMGVSHYQWDIVLLRLLGRRVVGHVRGCEGRERVRAMALPECRAMCWDCDYLPRPLCEGREQRRRRWIFRRLAHAILVTTPDLLDFWPEALHLPFFLPVSPPPAPDRQPWTPESGRPFRVVHVTNQPGIEGTYRIRRAVERLTRRGLPVEFIHVSGAPPAQVFGAYHTADLAVGKMLMGYYANAQIESLLSGLPTVCQVRPRFVTPQIEHSGLVLATFDDLDSVIERLACDPMAWAAKSAVARPSALVLHDPATIVAKLKAVYGWIG
jgi:hypothetical protein